MTNWTFVSERKRIPTFASQFSIGISKTHLKAIVVGAHVHILGTSQLKDVSQALENLRVDECHRYGTQLDAFVDFVIGVCLVRSRKFPQHKVVASRFEALQRTGIFVTWLGQTVFVFSSKWRRHDGHRMVRSRLYK